MPEDRVVIIGAGVGGLAAAVGLAARGVPVTVVERAAGPGGKLREVEVGGRRLDAGPTVLTMRWIFEEIFADAATSLDAHLTLEPLDCLARHYWAPDARLDLFADADRSADAIAEFAGVAEARGYLKFCARAKAVFDTLDHPFMRSGDPGLLNLIRGVGIGRPAALWGITPFSTLWKELGTYFRDPRLQQLFGRYATYCGSSPFQSPATLMLIAHVERMGVWNVIGGMHRIAVALGALAEKQGAVFRYNAHVTRIEIAGGRACGVRLADGTRLDARAVLLNGDAAALAAGSFGMDAAKATAPIRRADRSLSAVTWGLVAETGGVPLERHTVFFSRDYAAEFRDLFGSGRMTAEPTVYVCAQDRDGSARETGSGAERLFCIVNAPPAGDSSPLSDLEIEQCKRATVQTLARCGLTITPTNATMQPTTPADFERLFPGTGGALYGPASHGWQAAFRRPSAPSRIPGLYLAGGSVHPGPGVPMAALSGRMAASRIISDLASMRRSQRVVMPGGMSMR